MSQQTVHGERQIEKTINELTRKCAETHDLQAREEFCRLSRELEMVEKIRIINAINRLSAEK